jgi:lysozyme family protein
MAKFEIEIPRVLAHEGGYVNHPSDPGGETNRGITDRLDGKIDGLVDLDGDGDGDVDIRGLTEDQAKEVYRQRFWNRMNGD